MSERMSQVGSVECLVVESGVISREVDIDHRVLEIRYSAATCVLSLLN